jgi:hypothetical protein
MEGEERARALQYPGNLHFYCTFFQFFVLLLHWSRIGNRVFEKNITLIDF